MQRTRIQPGRRRFLKRLGMAGGAGAVLALSAQRKIPVERGPETPGGQPRNDQGYRLTAHIRSYYRKAGL